jgi:hypothetical protein
MNCCKKIVLLFVLIPLCGLAHAQSYGDYRVFCEVSGNGFAHLTQIYFDDDLWTPTEQPTYGWDECCDANFFPGNPGQPFVYTEVVAPPVPTPNFKLSINGLPHLFEPIDVPLGFIPGTLAEYTFSFSDLYTLPQGTTVELEDLSLQVTQDLMLDSSYVSWGAPSDDEARFVLHFNPSTVTGLPDYNEELQIEVVNRNGALEMQFNRPIENALIRVVDLSGRIVANVGVVSSSNFQLPLVNVSRGMLILEVVENGRPRLVQKLVL